MGMYVRPKQHETSTAARKLLAMAIPNQWIERLDIGGDYGIDDHIEIFHEGWTTGLLLMVQRKGFDEALPSTDTTEIVYDAPVRTLKYAELLANPVLLALVPTVAVTPCFYYVWLQEYIRVRLDYENPGWRYNKTSVRVRVPTLNRMPGDEGRLEFIAATPQRDRGWAQTARIAHELSWAAEASDFARCRSLVKELYSVQSIFGDPNWGWSLWARAQVLDQVHAAVEALCDGGAIAEEDLVAAGSNLAGEACDQDTMRFVLKSKVRVAGAQLAALLSSSYDTGLRRTIAEADGAWPY